MRTLDKLETYARSARRMRIILEQLQTLDAEVKAMYETNQVMGSPYAESYLEAEGELHILRETLQTWMGNFCKMPASIWQHPEAAHQYCWCLWETHHAPVQRMSSEELEDLDVHRKTCSVWDRLGHISLGEGGEHVE